MSDWPSSWRSLSWLSLAVEATRSAARWMVKRLIWQFDPDRQH